MITLLVIMQEKYQSKIMIKAVKVKNQITNFTIYRKIIRYWKWKEKMGISIVKRY